MLTNDELMELLRASKGRSVMDFGRAVAAAAERAAAERGPTCGENHAVDADLAGCGKVIEKQTDVYRCTHCGVPFHRDCAERHFVEDTPEHAAKQIDEQLRRMDERAAPPNAVRDRDGVVRVEVPAHGVPVGCYQTVGDQTPIPSPMDYEGEG